MAFPHYKYCPKNKIHENVTVQKNDLLDIIEINQNLWMFMIRIKLSKLRNKEIKEIAMLKLTSSTSKD